MVILIVFFTIFQSNNSLAFELEIYFESEGNGYSITDENYQEVEKIYSEQNQKIENLKTAIQNERMVADKIIESQKKEINELENEIEENEEKIEKIKIQIEKERKKVLLRFIAKLPARLIG